MCAETGSGFNPKNRFEDEITLEELVLSMAALLRWIRSHFVRLLIVLLISISLAIVWVIKQPVSYTAELTFMLNDENNPQVSGINSVLGQLGLPVTGGRYNVDKLLEIAKSRNLMQSTLLSEGTIEGKVDLLANHFIHFLELDTRWKYEDESLEGFLFQNGKPLETQKEFYVMKSLVDLIAGHKRDRSNALFTTDYGATDYIMSFVIQTPHEELSISFLNELYDKVSAFYVTQATQKNAEVLQLIEAKRDSLTQLINSKAFKAANLRDRNSASFRNTNRVEIALLEAELIALRGTMEEVSKNLERADFVLETSTPLIQILDRPVAPISPQKPGLIRTVLLGALAGTLIYLCLLFAKKVFSTSQMQSYG